MSLFSITPFPISSRASTFTSTKHSAHFKPLSLPYYFLRTTQHPFMAGLFSDFPEEETKAQMGQASCKGITHRTKKEPTFLPPAQCTLCNTHLVTGTRAWWLLCVALRVSQPQSKLNTQGKARPCSLRNQALPSLCQSASHEHTPLHGWQSPLSHLPSPDPHENSAGAVNAPTLQGRKVRPQKAKPSIRGHTAMLGLEVSPLRLGKEVCFGNGTGW